MYDSLFRYNNNVWQNYLPIFSLGGRGGGGGGREGRTRFGIAPLLLSHTNEVADDMRAELSAVSREASLIVAYRGVAGGLREGEGGSGHSSSLLSCLK